MITRTASGGFSGTYTKLKIEGTVVFECLRDCLNTKKHHVIFLLSFSPNPSSIRTRFSRVKGTH